MKMPNKVLEAMLRVLSHKKYPHVTVNYTVLKKSDSSTRLSTIFSVKQPHHKSHKLVYINPNPVKQNNIISYNLEGKYNVAFTSGEK